MARKKLSIPSIGKKFMLDGYMTSFTLSNERPITKAQAQAKCKRLKDQRYDGCRVVERIDTKQSARYHVYFYWGRKR